MFPVGRRNQTEWEQVTFGKVVKYGRELKENVIVTQKQKPILKHLAKSRKSHSVTLNGSFTKKH